MLLHVERVHPQLDAALEVAGVGVHGAPVPDEVGGVRVRRAQDPLPHDQSLLGGRGSVSGREALGERGERERERERESVSGRESHG